MNKSHFVVPDLLQNLVGIIFRFRERPFGLSADIEAMFMQVQVPLEDAKCLRLFGEKINQTTCPRLITLGKCLAPRTRQHVQIMFNNVHPQTMMKHAQSLLEL